MRHVFMLMSTTENDPDATRAFRKSLEILGWTEGQNIRIDYRWAAGSLDRARAYATEIAALAPKLIVTNGSQMLAAAQNATRTIPIVFVVVAARLVLGSYKILLTVKLTLPVLAHSNLKSEANGWSC